jgi:hypothetical protein
MITARSRAASGTLFGPGSIFANAGLLIVIAPGDLNGKDLANLSQTDGVGQIRRLKNPEPV